MVSLVIFDFDGTLFDTHESIEHSIKLAFEHLTPDNVPAFPDIHRMISNGSGLSDTFRALSPGATSVTEADFEKKYREIYATDGQPLVKAFPGAKELLVELRARQTPVAILSNKGVVAIRTALRNNGLDALVPDDLIVGDKTPGATRKPDIGSFANVIAPTLESNHGFAKVDPSTVFVVGDTAADVKFAKNIGAKSCWCRYGYGDRQACEELRPDHIVGSLHDIIRLMQGL